MKYSIEQTNQFKRERKKAVKSGCNIEKLENIVTRLAKGEQLPPQNNDHKLSGKYEGCRECHIEPDWLLIYQIYEDRLLLVLTRTGSHSRLFG